MAVARRRGLALGGTAWLAGAAIARSTFAQAGDHAVFTEFSPDTKPMKPGWNRRVFTDTDSRKGSAIDCDFATGVVTLVPGAYRLSGMSTVAYHTASGPPESTTVRSPAAAGYCRLRAFDPTRPEDPLDLLAVANDDPSVICVGSTSTANMVPSLFEGFVERAAVTRIVLEHQSGSNPHQIYLRVFAQNSRWHALARLAIRRL
jgi:hypothetical protein